MIKHGFINLISELARATNAAAKNALEGQITKLKKERM